MTYNPNVPIVDVPPNEQTASMATNFAQFAAIFSSQVGNVIYNHTPINAFKQGQHEAVIMEANATDPGSILEMAILYNKVASSNQGSAQQLFAQIPKFLPTSLDPNTGTTAGMQLTCSQVNTTGPTQFQSFLPGGYTLYFGTTTEANLTITLSPAPTKILTVIAYSNLLVGSPPNPRGVNVTSVTSSSFTLFTNGPVVSCNFTWLAICQA